MTTRRQFVGTLPAFVLLGAAGRLIFAAAPARAQDSALSPDPFDADTVERRAIEAMIWGMPAVNRDLMYQAMLRETPGPRQPDALLVARCSTGRTRRSRPTPT